jgi:hypothetical protein
MGAGLNGRHIQESSTVVFDQSMHESSTVVFDTTLPGCYKHNQKIEQMSVRVVYSDFVPDRSSHDAASDSKIFLILLILDDLLQHNEKSESLRTLWIAKLFILFLLLFNIIL